MTFLRKFTGRSPRHPGQENAGTDLRNVFCRTPRGRTVGRNAPAPKNTERIETKKRYEKRQRSFARTPLDPAVRTRKNRTGKTRLHFRGHPQHADELQRPAVFGHRRHRPVRQGRAVRRHGPETDQDLGRLSASTTTSSKRPLRGKVFRHPTSPPRSTATRWA